MGRGEDLRLALPEQEDEQRLRAAAGERGGLHLRGDEPPDGEEIGTLMRVFRQFQDELPRIPLLKLSEKSDQRLDEGLRSPRSGANGAYFAASCQRFLRSRHHRATF